MFFVWSCVCRYRCMLGSCIPSLPPLFSLSLSLYYNTILLVRAYTTLKHPTKGR
jgi:hypothetical protein